MTKYCLLARPNLGIARRKQCGATLIVGLIMLVLITLMVLSAFNMSSSNLKSVGNMQVHDEAVAAANQAVESVIGSTFTDTPVAQDLEVDINNDGSPDYKVAITKPTCIRAVQASDPVPSDVELGPSMSTGSTWQTDWDIDAKVTDLKGSGAEVNARQGVRVLLSQVQKQSSCN